MQRVYLATNERQWVKNHRRRRIHKAERFGTSGRRLVVGAQCQIYQPYFENYDILTDLHSLGVGLEGWSLCRHCFPDGRESLPATAFTDIRAKQLVAI